MNEHAAFILGVCAGLCGGQAIRSGIQRDWICASAYLGVAFIFLSAHLWVFR